MSLASPDSPAESAHPDGRSCRIRFARRPARGLSLVEILVSLALGLVLVAAVLSMYLAAHETYRRQEAFARLQESGRFAVELMTREIREAGLNPCGSPLTANLLVSGTAASNTWWADTASGFLRGGEASGQGVVLTGNSVAAHAASTDSLLVLRPTHDENLLATVLQHDPAAWSMTVSVPTPPSGRDIVLLCDDRSSALWQVDTVQRSPTTLTYASSPLNCTTALGQVDAQCQSTVDKTFLAGARLAPWDPGLWYVGPNDSGERSLYRAEVIQPAANAPSRALVTRAVEKVPGIHDLQIDYLTRDRSQGGALATRWQTADDLAGQWADPAFEVAAVRLTLTLRGPAPAAASQQPVLERTMRTVVALRSREP